MALRDNLIRILREYPKAIEKPFRGHPLANFIRQDLPESLKNLCETQDRYKWQGSAGQGNWTRSPWLAIFDILITDTAQSGYYPVYLYREDFTGLYLSLNQGVTEIREKYRSEAKDALRTRAADFRAQIAGLMDRYPETDIDLRPSSASNLAAFYEAGNICAKFYGADSVPSNEELISDFYAILQLYDILSYNETIPVSITAREEDEASHALVEDLRNFRQHKRVERNAKLALAAKKFHGYTCKLCGFNFEKTYGAIGHHYIEAHHLTPISELKGKKLLLDPEKDFAVLCSNCHRMIHRCEHPHDVEAFREKYL